MRSSIVSRTVIVAATLSAAFSVAPGAMASVAGDHDDHRGESYSERGESYSEHEHEESYSEREYSYSDDYDRRDRRHHNDPTQWHFADPAHGDFDHVDGQRRDRGHRHHDHRGPRAGDGGDGGR